MDNDKTVGIVTYTGLLQKIKNLLDKTPEGIIEKYSDNEINLLTWEKKQVKEERLEIRFDEEQATLTCEFDRKRICKAVNIFTDSNPTKEECIRTLNKNYAYNWFFNKWKTPCCYLYLHQMDEMIYFKCIKKHFYLLF